MAQFTIVPKSRFARLAAWCYVHKKRTVFAWFVALVVFGAGAATVGSNYVNSGQLPNTESQSAYDLLDAHFPAQNGDTDQFVFKAKSGTLDDAANRRSIEDALAQVAALKKTVVSVQSPLDDGGGQINAAKTIGVAQVTYSDLAQDLDVKDLKKVRDAGFTARSATLQVEQGGNGAQFVRFSETQSPTQFIGILAASLVLAITFGSLVAAGIPLLTALLSLGSTLGLILLMTNLMDTPDFATQLAELIGLGVGIDYALFVMTRYRSEVAKGRSRPDAIVVSMDTAGRTVFFAAITVIIALLGLLTLGLSFLYGVAIACSMAVLVTMFAALTLLPALIGGAGDKIDRLRLPTLRRGPRKEQGGDSAAWKRWSQWVQKHSWVSAGVSAAVLIALAIPAFSMDLGSSDAGTNPEGSTTRIAYDLIAEGFGAGINGPFLLAVELPSKGDKAAAQKVADAAAKADGIKSVTPPAISPDGAVATINAFPDSGPQDRRTARTLESLRDDTLHPLAKETGVKTYVGGFTASNEDFTTAIAKKLPFFVGAIVLLSALLLLAVFRSVLIPIKAAAMNLLSIGASLGIVTLIFQEGVLAGPLGIDTGPIESFLPVMLFAIVFGLSMDYEVFLVSRIHEEVTHGASPSDAVSRGLAATGRVITAAATIMVLVFASFVLGDDRVIKLFGIGLATAIFVDAVIIRCLLVPALMEIMGGRAWWLPRWLDKIVPRIDIEGADLHEHKPDAPATA